MTAELTQTHNQSVKSVEFFPYEWSSNLLAVCLKDSIKIYVYEEVIDQEEASVILRSSNTKSRLRQIVSIPSNNRINHFSWSPKSNIATMEPSLYFASCDSENTLTFYKRALAVNLVPNTRKEDDFVPKESLSSFDHVHKIAFDCYHGELLAYTADNYCFLWDTRQSVVKAKFVLQSPGINICWHREETNKLMVIEKCGLIRVYSLTTLQPVFTLLSLNNKINSLPLLSADWCQKNPAIVIANTNADLFLWNTSHSCLGERLHQDSDCIKSLKLSPLKENVVGYISGNDVSSKLKLINYKTNEIIYQKKDIKLFKSFSFNASQQLVAIASENKLSIIKILY